MPGSEEAPVNLAPQPLDHFKRGYRERAELRDRETNQLAVNTEYNHRQQQQHSSNGHNDGYDNHNDNDRPASPNGQGGSYHGPSSRFSPTAMDNHNSHTNNSNNGTSNNHNHHNSSNGGSNNHDNGNGRQYHDGVSAHRGRDAAHIVDSLCRPGCNVSRTMDEAWEHQPPGVSSNKVLTAILSGLARRRKMGLAQAVWQWMDHRGIQRTVYHYNSLISVCEKTKDCNRALRLFTEMEKNRIDKNEVTFSSTISACEKAGQWRTALDLLERMKKEGVERTTIAYNAAIRYVCKSVSVCSLFVWWERAQGIDVERKALNAKESYPFVCHQLSCVLHILLISVKTNKHIRYPALALSLSRHTCTHTCSVVCYVVVRTGSSIDP